MDETDAQQQPYWSALEEIARPARERRRLHPDVRSEIIVRLCRLAPLSVKDLSVLLDRSEAYVGDAIRPLVMSGALTFLYPDQPRHPRQKYLAAPGESTPLPADDLDLPELDLEPVPELEPEAVAERVEPRDRRPGVREERPAAPLAAAESAAPRFPNQATNLVFVGLVGLILGLTGFAWWWLVAMVAALGLALLHLKTGSAQFRQFASLRFFGSKEISFVVLKSLVAVLEIAVVFLVVRALAGSA